MRKALIAAAAGVMLVGVPATAYAARHPHPKPDHPVASTSSHDGSNQSNKPHDPQGHNVTYVLRGALSNFIPATTSASGSVTITVTSSNFDQRMLTTTALTIPVTTKTIVVAPGGAIANGEQGIVKVRAPRDATAASLVANSAFEVIAQGSNPSSDDHADSPHDVTYVLRGALSNYVPATSSASGSITIAVTSSNFDQRMLTTTALTIPVTTKTIIVAPGGAIANGEHGIVKVRAPRDATAATLVTNDAFEVIVRRSEH